MKIIFVFVTVCIVCGAQAGVVFSDTFSGEEGSADSLWNNEYAFVVENGAYNAVFPNNNPLAVTTIKNLTVTNAVVDVDILSSVDGGIMLHTQGLAGNGNMNGVLLVVNPAHGNIYWHVVHDGGDWTMYGVSGLSAASGTDLHITVQVIDDTYEARAYRLSDNQLVGQTTLVNSTYSSGGIGLYDYIAAQRFDNVEVSIPEPATMILLGLGGLLLGRKRRA